MSITRRGPGRAVAAGAAVLLGLTGAVCWWLAGPAAVTPIGGAFRLIDAQQRTVTERSFRGRYMLVYFGYTACPDVCPTTLHEMGVAMQALGAARGKVQPVFVTVDPTRDTPEVLRAYVGAIDPSITALTGAPDAVAAMLRQYHVHSARVAPGHAGSYLVDHSAVLYLMAPDGRFLAPLPADATGAAMAKQIVRYLS